MARAEAQFIPRLVPSGVVDVVVRFLDFPKTGTTRTNRPHSEITKNDEQIHEDQPFFTGSTYQLDPERIPVKAGDRVEVSCWWASGETRDGSSQEKIVVGYWRS